MISLHVPWLLWLSGLSASLQTKGLLVQYPVRAHAWVTGQVPRGCVGSNHILVFLYLSSALPPSLKINKILALAGVDVD